MLLRIADSLVEGLRTHISGMDSGAGAPDAAEYVVLRDIAKAGPKGSRKTTSNRLVVSLVRLEPDLHARHEAPRAPGPIPEAESEAPFVARFLITADYADHDLALHRLYQAFQFFHGNPVLSTNAENPRTSEDDRLIQCVIANSDEASVAAMWQSLRTPRRPAFQIECRSQASDRHV